MRIRGLIADVDGTLLDSMSVWETIGERYLRSLGLEPRENLWETFRTFTLEQSAQYYRDHYGVQRSVPEIMDGINCLIEDQYFHQIQLRPGVAGFLQDLADAGVSMAIATATDRYLVEAALERCGVLDFFGEIFTCTESGSKNDPEIYEQARCFLGTDQAETWVAEDAFHAAKTAAEAGFPVLGIRDPSEKNQRGLREVCTVCLEDFREADRFWKIVSR